MPLVKPGRWSVNPADVEHSQLMADAQLLVPLWENSGKPFNYGNTARGVAITEASHNATLWHPGPLGVSPIFDEGVTAAHAYSWGPWPNNDQFTFLIVLKRDRTGTEEVPFAQGIATSRTNQKWHLILDSEGTTDVLRVIGVSSIAFMPLTGLQDTSVPHTIIGTCDGLNATCWVDGVKHTDTISGGLEIGADSMKPAIGCYPSDENSDSAFDGDIYLAALWHRPILEGTARFLSKDPFGLIRPQLFSPLDEVPDTTKLAVIRRHYHAGARR